MAMLGGAASALRLQAVLVVLLPSLVFSLVPVEEHRQAKLAKHGSAITDLALITDESSCGALGPFWSWAGPSAMASPLMPQNSWLCVQSNPEASEVLTKIGFTILAQHDDDKHRSSFLSRGGATLVANVTASVSRATDEHVGCQALGGQGWMPLGGSLQPASSQQVVHMCGLFEERQKASAADQITGITPSSLGQTRSTPCSPSGTGLGPGTELLEVPGFDLEALYENPLLLCVSRDNRNAAPQTALYRESPFDSKLAAPDSPIGLDDIVAAATDFPSRSLDVSKDRGNESRRHVFVLGPESSGTRLWASILREGLGMGGEAREFVINNQAAVFHISLPEGAWCGKTHSVPEYTDFGGGLIDYINADRAIQPLSMSDDLADRYYVRPLQVVRQHEDRGDEVTVVLVARDPRASYEGKIADKHCSNQPLAKREQTEAFRLMVEAARANSSSVHIVCYEDMLPSLAFSGKEYIQSKLSLMKVTVSSDKIPTIYNGNAQYRLDRFIQDDCNADMLAYWELCPHTELGKQVQKTCMSDGSESESNLEG